MKAEPIAKSVQKTSNFEFRLRVFSMNTRHHSRTCHLIHDIHLDYSFAESSYEY